MAMSIFSGKGKKAADSGPQPWPDEDIRVQLDAARRSLFREPDMLATAAVMYAEQAARVIDRESEHMTSVELAAALVSQSQARALASIAESLSRITALMDNAQPGAASAGARESP
jgi:hypothetical protein